MGKFLKVNLLVMLILSPTVANSLANDYWNKELMRAILSSDITSVDEAVSKGANINMADDYGNTPLILATDLGHFDIVKLLIDNKATIDLPNKHGYTPLMLALTSGHRDIGIMLLREGADVDKQNIYGTSPRMYLKVLGFFNVDEYLSGDKPAFSTVVDDRGARSGTMTVNTNPLWLQNVNELMLTGDYDAVTNYLIELSEQGNHEASYMLGGLLITSGKIESGLIWLKMASQTKNPELLYQIARLVINDEITYDAELGISSLIRAMDAGVVPAKSAYARCLLFGIGVDRNVDRALILFNEAIDEGNLEALYYKSMMYLNGVGVPMSVHTGRALMIEAAHLGYGDAIDYLNEKEFEKFATRLENSTISDKPKLKVYLPSINAPLILSENKCDTYSLVDTFNNAYNIDRVTLCYPGDATIRITYNIASRIPKDDLEYLHLIAKKAIFRTVQGN